MEFNLWTLKEENVRCLTDVWDLELENLVLPKNCLDINCAFGFTTRHLLYPKLHINSTILGKNIINYKKICLIIIMTFFNSINIEHDL